MQSPFRIRVYDRAFSFLFQLSDPLSVSVTTRHLAKGTATVVIPLGHRRTDALMAPGVRLVIEYLTAPDGDYADGGSWLRVLSGPVWTRAGDGGQFEGTITLTVEDDYRLLATALAWPDPTKALNAQPLSRSKTGNAETVIKAFITENLVTRLGVPITVASNGNRGQVVSVSLRFDSLDDALPPLATVGGLGIRITQRVMGAGYDMDVYVPADRTARPLSEQSGSLLDWAFSSTGPTATRAIVGGAGEGTLRGFIAATDTGRESEWGMKVETFVDASGATSADDLAQAGAEALNAGQPGAGFSITAAETGAMRYGRDLFVGDLIAVQITESLSVTDVLQSVALTWTTDEGLKITPQVGDGSATESPDAVMARAIARMYSGLKKLRSAR